MYSIDYNDGFRLKKQYPDGTIVTVGSGAGCDGRGMAYDDASGILYATGNPSYNGLYTVNTATGGGSYIGNMGSGTSYFFGLREMLQA